MSVPDTWYCRLKLPLHGELRSLRVGHGPFIYIVMIRGNVMYVSMHVVNADNWHAPAAILLLMAECSSIK